MIRRAHRLPLFLTFTFCMVATLSFLLVKNLATTSAANLSNFKAGDIISDEVMGDYNSMSVSDIQNFLKSKNSCNNTNVWVPSSGNIASSLDMSGNYNWHVENGHFVCMADESFDGESAAQIIYNAAQDYKINPKVIIVLLQKEQGLVTDTRPRSGQYRSATGYGCPDTAACDTQYYGFKNQVRNATKLFSNVLNGGWTNYPVGNNYIYYNPNKDCGGSNVYIENRATSALYRYTPYQPNASALAAGYGTGDSCGAYGNRNFYAYFTDWFGDTHYLSSFDASSLSNIYIPNGDYYLLTNSGKALDVYGNSSTSGANVDIWSAHYGASEKFHISHTSDGFYKITNVASGKAIDVTNASKYSGANVEIWESNNSCAQKWAISLYQGHYIFRNTCGGMALDVYGGSAKDGANVQTYTYHGGASQQWNLKSADEAPLPDGTYSLLTYKGKALDVYGAYTNDGANVDIWDNHDGNSQEFTITRSDDGFYRIKNTRANKSLDVYGASANSGANVDIYSDNSSCSQKWAISKTSDGYYVLRNACGGTALDVYGGYTERAGSNIDAYTYHGGNSQKWQLASSSQSSLLSGTYRLTTSGDKALNVTGTSIGANVNIANLDNSSKSQQFAFSRTSDGYFAIRSLAASNRYLDVTGGGTISGLNIETWTGNSSCAQKWFITNATSDYYYLSNLCGGHALDVVGAQTSASGANVEIYSHNTSGAQYWKISKI